MSKSDVDHIHSDARPASHTGLPRPVANSRLTPGKDSPHPERSWASFLFGLWLLAAISGFVELRAEDGETPPEGAPPVTAEVLPTLPTPVAASREALPEALHQLTPASLEQLSAIEQHVRALVDRVSPAVVAVRIGMATGSGVVVSPDGLVLSAAHVGVEPGREARFTFPNGRTATGRTLGLDHGMDAGLMRITEGGPWPHVELAEPDSAVLGDWVLALGHPGGYDAERPVLVRLGRILWRAGSSICTDCTIVSGDSGGPLFDMHGRVIGIHSRISESAAANFHAPIGGYVANWDRLARGESWGARGPRARAWVGLRGVDHPEGFQLERVVEDGPAFRAGLRDGDLVTRCNGRPVTDYESFLRTLSQVEPGEQILLGVRRDEAAWEVGVTVEARRRGGGPFGRR